MKAIIILIGLLTSLQVFAQKKTESFHIGPAGDKVRGSLYNSIKVFDIREDTSNLGFIQKGAFNTRLTVVPGEPLGFQLSSVLNGLIEADAGNGELLLLIRKMFFLEATGAFKEKGFFQFRAQLFRKEGERYRQISSIDSVLVVKAMDVTKKMLQEGNRLVIDYIAANLTNEAGSDMVLTVDQMPLIDSLEKLRIPLYANATLTTGIYRSFKTFAKQQPDEVSINAIFTNKGKLYQAQRKNSYGDWVPLDYHEVYAFVWEGKPYISSGTVTAYPLIKKNDEFHFIGKAPNVNPGDVAVVTAFFGLLGGALVALTSTSEFQFRIDHLTGGYITERQIDKYHHENKKTRYDIE
jgi:hypothetical protein